MQECEYCKFGECVDTISDIKLNSGITIHQRSAKGIIKCTNEDDSKSITFDEDLNLNCSGFIPREN